MNNFVELAPQVWQDLLPRSGEGTGHPVKGTLDQARTLQLAPADFSFIFTVGLS